MTRAPSRPRTLPSRRLLLTTGALLPLAGASLTACGDGEADGEQPDLRAEVDRAEPGPAEGAGGLVVPFTSTLLGAIDRDVVNAICSPLSAQVALTMIGMGAAGQTRGQMEDVLGGSMDELAENANTLAQLLAVVGDEEREAGDEDAPEPARAALVNGTWIQEGFEVQEPFLEDLATWFGSGLFEADFTEEGPREEARGEINGWVAENTDDLIEELVPDGVLDDDTRLVLVNALHLRAAWPQSLTSAGGTFTTADGEERSTEMLHAETTTWYEDSTCRATSLDTYGEELALALVQPAEDLREVLDAWAQAADETDTGLGALLAGLEDSQASVELTVPAVDIAWEDSLKPALQELGMSDAFDTAADFSGVTAQADLVIADVLQKAVITIDEDGMEAAAATAVVAGVTSAPVSEQELVLDSPFLLVAYQRATLAPLVIGWVGDPTQTR